jgi:O-antigen ligase
MYDRMGALLASIFAGLFAGLSVLALGTKAIVLVPALACAFAMTLVPYSPLYAIVATVPINVEIAGPITVVRLAIVFGVFVAIIQGVKKQAPKLHIPWPEGGVTLCLFIWIFFATVAKSEGELVGRLGGFFIYAVVFFIVLAYVDTYDRLRNVVITMFLVGIFQGFVVVLEAQFGIVTLGGIQADLQEEGGEDTVRVVGASAHPIFLASFFQVVMVFAILLMLTTKNRIVQLFMLASLGLFLLGWINAWSRSTWIGMAVMIGVALFFWSRPSRVLAVVGGVIGLFILSAHDFSMSAVMTTIDNLAIVEQRSFRAGVSESSDSFSWRTENWTASVSIWASNPIFGVGVDMVHVYMPEHLPPGAMGHRFTNPALPHNMFLQVLAEAGLPALIMFVSLWISALVALARAWPYERLRPYAFALLVILTGQLTTYFFNPIPRDIWFSLALALVLGRMARRLSLGESIDVPPGEAKASG